MNVLVILGHPRRESFCGELAAAYAAGAVEAGVKVKYLAVAEMRFDPDVHHASPCQQELEEDVRRAQEMIRWADHLVFVFPTWWGAMPALLKAFLDRVLTPGFAFAEKENGGYEQLLRGKSAHLLTTMDTPPWVYRWILRRPGVQAIKAATLEFCGVRPVRVSLFGPIKDSQAAQRAQWLEQARRAGLRLRGGVRTRGERLRDKALVWLRAMRLQFYPMTWLAYTLGALGVAALSGTLRRDVYWLGYGFLFFLEVATVFLNDYFDFESDRHNQHAGPFSGGSRVLVEKQLSFGEMRAGIAVAIGLTLLLAVLLLRQTPNLGVTLALLLLATLLALGYTVPPLKLAYRGAAELDVCLTHSVLLVFCGYLFQGGAWHDALPWLLSAPLFLAGWPSITLAGIPDRSADRAVSKRTLAVMLGARRAALLALLATLVSAAVAALWQSLGAAGNVFAGLAYFVWPHALLLSFLLLRQVRSDRLHGRIDLLMVVSLSYLLWFGAIPAFHLRNAAQAPAQIVERPAQEK